MKEYLTHHKKLVYTITALMAGVFLLAITGVLVVNSRSPSLETRAREQGEQSEQGERVPNPTAAPVNLFLKPESATVPVGATVAFTIVPQVEGKISGLDLLFTFDPAMLEFVGVENVPAGYMKARALAQNDTAIISIIESLGAPNAQTGNSELGTVVFRAKMPGTTRITPILRNEASTSMLLVGTSTQNMITGITSPQVIITP